MSDTKRNIDHIVEVIQHLKDVLDSAKEQQEIPEEVLFELEEGCLAAYEAIVKYRLHKELSGEKNENSEEEEQLPNQLQMDFAAQPARDQQEKKVKIVEEQKDTQNDSFKSNGTTSSLAEMRIGINDKFRFIKELFEESTQEYNIAINQINQIDESNEAIRYINSLRDIYRWEDDDPCYNDFIQLIKQRYE